MLLEAFEKKQHYVSAPRCQKSQPTSIKWVLNQGLSFIALTGFYVSLPKVHRVLHINWHYNTNFMFPEFQELPLTFFEFESK